MTREQVGDELRVLWLEAVVLDESYAEEGLARAAQLGPVAAALGRHGRDPANRIGKVVRRSGWRALLRRADRRVVVGLRRGLGEPCFPRENSRRNQRQPAPQSWRG